MTAPRVTHGVVYAPAYVYVLISGGAGARILSYVGWTLDLERRLAEHNRRSGAKKGARTTAGRVWKLVYAERHPDRGTAMRREAALKKDRAFRAALRGL